MPGAARKRVLSRVHPTSSPRGMSAHPTSSQQTARHATVHHRQPMNAATHHRQPVNANVGRPTSKTKSAPLALSTP
eukprot:7909031-Heterocapsa_arctica.AAC.1